MDYCVILKKFRFIQNMMRQDQIYLDEFVKVRNIIFIEIDQCVMDFFKLNEINYFNYTSVLHPGKIAHEAYAKCILDELKKKKLI